MQPEIRSLLGQSLVLMLVAGVCLLAIRSLIREHRSSGSSCKGGCSGCGMDEFVIVMLSRILWSAHTARTIRSGTDKFIHRGDLLPSIFVLVKQAILPPG
ncbi:MAG: FeoB-associated Cys-rich membrane protein [Holdemania massiliensis]